LVSGTSFAMKTTPKPQILAYMKNVPEKACTSQSSIRTLDNTKEVRSDEASPAELHLNKKLNVYETIQEQIQLTKLQRVPAEPFTFMGNI
jgi:hypothetical protein